MGDREALILLDLTFVDRLRAARAAEDWRLSDVAAYATAELRSRGYRPPLVVSSRDVGWLEHGGRLRREKEAAVVHVLGLEEFAAAFFGGAG